ncbi:unnamed protein product [Orchesella dallaii]|uniref:Odorant receptor n=1 Tax=Orchesella dallaii TaxID=48710 RepID=A0ABP1S738_9HEXA
MISPNFLRIVKCRMALMKFSHFTFISWESDTNRMVLKRNPYCIYSSCCLTFYLYAVGAFSLYTAYEYISPEPENGESDVFDVDFQPRDEALSLLCGLAHLMYALACTGMIGNLGVLMITKRLEFVNFINMTIQNDLRYQEIYKEYLNRHPNTNRYHTVSDSVLLLLAVGTLVVPILFGFVIFQEFFPEHQILLEYFEIKVKFEWKFLILHPFISYIVLQAADILFIIDVAGMSHMTSCPNWLELIQPDNVEIEEGTPKFRCHIGCTLNEVHVLRFYQEQQLLQEAFNDMFANHLVTGHHSSFLHIITFGLFICIRYWRIIHKPGFLMAPVAAFLCMLTEYIEVRLVERVANTSGEYLHTVRVLAKKEGKRLRRLQKCLKSYRPLQPQLAYPYYTMTRENFLLFVNSIIANLVSFLVSYN